MRVVEDSPAGNKPTVSVVIVIDYKVGDGSDVNHLVPTLRIMAATRLGTLFMIAVRKVKL